LHLPLAVEAGETFLAGEELLHGGLFEVALLDDELGQRTDQCIHIAQRPRDGALFGERWNWERYLHQIRFLYMNKGGFEAVCLLLDVPLNSLQNQERIEGREFIRIGDDFEDVLIENTDWTVPYSRSE